MCNWKLELLRHTDAGDQTWLRGRNKKSAGETGSTADRKVNQFGDWRKGFRALDYCQDLTSSDLVSLPMLSIASAPGE